MHWIIGTAGHIDHGKTSLIKALTGTDTDRLKEEKQRGISIDIGFAALDLPGGSRAGVVDVPGHERFVKNMLAGAHGIDLVLFTVAADDGVMPQTEEHLDIVHLLGVRRAVFVITKADLVPAARLAAVREEILALVAGTALEGSPIVTFALPTGEGLADVRREIAHVLLDGGSKPQPPGRFRLPVDRVFVSPGHGLIVTGTAISGTVQPGDRVRCLPSGEPLRVRGVEVHGASVEQGAWGQRLALNLTGSNPDAITRGDVICDEAVTLTSDRIDAVIEVRPSAARGFAQGLKAHQRVRVHLGTAERLGKVIPLGSPEHPAASTLAPGSRGFCQLVLDQPIAVMRGDHFIVRDETAQRTLGGGVVIEAAAPKRRRADASLLPRLEALAHGDDAVLLEAIVENAVVQGDFAVPLATLAQLVNDVDDQIRARADAAPTLHTFVHENDTRYATERACAAIKRQIGDAVRRWHAEQPLSPGLDIEDARSRMSPAPPARIFRLLVDEMARDHLLVRDGNLVRAPGHTVQVTGEDQVAVARITALLDAAPLAPPDVKQLAEMMGLDRFKLLPLLRAMEKQQQVVAVAPDLYFAAPVVNRLRDDLLRDLADGRALTTAAFRDRYETTRKYAIPLLEYFDRTGVTVRMGEARHLKRASGKTPT